MGTSRPTRHYNRAPSRHLACPPRPTLVSRCGRARCHRPWRLATRAAVPHCPWRLATAVRGLASRPLARAALALARALSGRSVIPRLRILAKRRKLYFDFLHVKKTCKNMLALNFCFQYHSCSWFETPARGTQPSTGSRIRQELASTISLYGLPGGSPFFYFERALIVPTVFLSL